MTINELAKQAHDYAKSIHAYECPKCGGKSQTCTRCSGFNWPAKQNVVDKIEEELAEFWAADSYITGFHKDSEESEIADMILTLLAYCIEMSYDPEKLLQEKADYNLTRREKEGIV